MLYPETKERVNRFKLALRMGLPVFALAVITVTSLLLRYFNQIPTNFIIVAITLLGIMVYYLFYLIYQGFDERITDPITHTFTREYFVRFIEKESQKRTYTLLLFGIENLSDINIQYGYQNGDMILRKIAQKLNDYFASKGFNQIVLARFKGADIIVALEGKEQEFKSMMELMCVRFRHKTIDDIDVDMIGSIVDTSRTRDSGKLIEHLYDLLSENRENYLHNEEEIDLELFDRLVIDAIKNRNFIFRYQAVYTDSDLFMYEMSIKMRGNEAKMVHQKRFMPAISRLGLQRDFDTLQLDRAVEQIKTLPDHVAVAINISANSLRNSYFFEYVTMHFSNNPTLKERLYLIFSENSYYYQSERFNSRLQAFRRAGVGIVLDRLGGVHTTLRYLQELEVDAVRYDYNLTRHIDRSVQSALIEGFEKTLKSLGIRSWCSHIENEMQQRTIKALGVDLMQGNYLNPIEELNDEIR